MKARTVTVIALVACAAVLLAWEVYTLVNGETGDTISAVIMDAAYRWPLVPFVAGLLMGHFFWPNKDTARKD